MKGQKQRRAIDAQVGGRIRQRRLELGMTLMELADLVGETLQHVRKQEVGELQIRASQLHAYALALGLPIDDFFAEPDARADGVAPAGRNGATVPSREAQALVRAYYLIRQEPARDAIRRVVAVLARRRR